MRRSTIRAAAALLMCLIWALAAAGLATAARYEALIPLLVPIDGWKGREPEGIDMDMGGTRMVQAIREYNAGGRSMTAMLMVGNAAMSQGMMRGTQAGSMETTDVQVTAGPVDGFQVNRHHDKRSGEGAVVVLLGGGQQKAATFILQYAGMSPEEALAAARKFDWPKMKAAAEKLP